MIVILSFLKMFKFSMWSSRFNSFSSSSLHHFYTSQGLYIYGTSMRISFKDFQPVRFCWGTRTRSQRPCLRFVYFVISSRRAHDLQIHTYCTAQSHVRTRNELWQVDFLFHTGSDKKSSTNNEWASKRLHNAYTRLLHSEVTWSAWMLHAAG